MNTEKNKMDGAEAFMDFMVSPRKETWNPGKIYQRKEDNRWTAYVSWTDPETKKYQVKFVYGKTEQEVKEKHTRLQSRFGPRPERRWEPLTLNKLANGEDPTLEQYLKMWLKSANNSLKANTVHQYRAMCDANVIPFIGSLKLKTLNPLQMDTFFGDIKEQGRPMPSIRITYGVLKSAFSKAVDWKMLATNPLDGVDKPKSEAPEFTVWTPLQAKQFIKANADHRMAVLWELALSTGMRQGEMLGLRWEDLSFSTNMIHVRHNLSEHNGKITGLHKTKTKTSRRNINVAPSLMNAFRAVRHRQIEEGNATTHYVFCTRDGNPHLKGNIHTYFKTAIRTAGVPEIRFHDMRHTHATMLLSMGVPIKVVAERLGHSNVQTTLHTYAHVLPGQQAEAARITEDLLK